MKHVVSDMVNLQRHAGGRTRAALYSTTRVTTLESIGLRRTRIHSRTLVSERRRAHTT
jgi:hypothetical protein